MVVWIDPYRFASAASSFSPTDIAALKTWHDASDTSTITDAGGGAVSAWTDKSGNDRTLSQATSARRPVTGVTTLNGLNVLDFAGDDSLADASGPTSFWDFLHDGANGPASVAEVWMIVKPGTTANPNVYMVMCATFNGVSGNTGATLLYDDRSSLSRSDRLDALVLTGTAFNTAVLAGTPNGFIAANNFHMLEWIIDASNATTGDRNTFIVDEGTPSKTNTATNAVSTDDAAQGLVVGAETAASTANGLVGSVAEILTFDGALTTDERTALRTYLKDKWGL